VNTLKNSIIALMIFMTPYAATPKTDDMQLKVKPPTEPYHYKFVLGDAVLEKGPTHTELKFSMKLTPKTDEDKALLAAYADTPLALVNLNAYLFTLYTGDHKATEPADLFPWETKKRIRFFLLKTDSEKLSKKNKVPTLIVKLMYPNYLTPEDPSVKIEDTEKDISAKLKMSDVK
jgi:hypothetical protein